MFWNGQKTSRKLLLTCVLCVAIAAWCSLWVIQNQRTTQQYWTSRPMSHSYLQTVSVKCFALCFHRWSCAGLVEKIDLFSFLDLNLFMKSADNVC